MGGNIFDQNVRADPLTYHRILTHVRDVLASSLNAQTTSIPFYRQKESFGDVDIIVEKEKVCFPQDEDRFKRLKQIINQHFHSSDHIHVNDQVISFLYREKESDQQGVQVDLIATQAHEMNITKDYFSYNDLGNLIGRIAHKMGVSFGHRGLLLVVREGTHVHDTIIVSQDTPLILEFLGYDPEKFRQGFDTPSDIFDYVVSTPFFNKDLYLLENRNHVSRTRDRKRANYRGFLEYIEQRNLPSYEYPEDKKLWLPRLTEFFPNLPSQIKKVEEDIKERKQQRSLYNGHVIQEITSLQGKDLGKVMSAFQSRFNDRQELIEYITTHPTTWKEEVKELALKIISIQPKPKM